VAPENGLGIREAPANMLRRLDEMPDQSGRWVELKFEGERSLDRVCYYFGVNRNDKF